MSFLWPRGGSNPSSFVCQTAAADEYLPDIKKSGGSVMTSRLALCATVAATVLFSAGASAQTYEVTRLVPGSAFHGVHGIGIDKPGRMFADGKLIVAEVGAKRIVEIDPQSGNVSEIAGNLPIGLVGAPGGLPTNIPTGVGVGASGTIYFSSDIENAMYKVARK